MAGGQATLKEAAASWWTMHAQFLKSSDDIKDQLEVCRRLLDFDLDVRDVKTLHLVEAVARRRGEVTQFGRHPSNATVNREIPYTIRPILNHAASVMDVRGMATIDWSKVTLRKVKPKVREMTDKTVDRITAELLPHYKELFYVYMTYGLRWKEAFFPPERLDIDGRRIFLRERKGGDWHTTKILSRDVRMFASRKSRAEAANLRTIWYRETSDGLEPIHPRAFQSYMKKLVKRLNLDQRAVHDLRHHAAMQAMRRTGGAIGKVQRLLGHESLVTTAVYAHAVEDDILDALGEENRPSPHKNPTSHDQGAETKRKTKRT